MEGNKRTRTGRSAGKVGQEMNNNIVSLDSEPQLFEEALNDCDAAKIKKLISSGFYINQIIANFPPVSLALIKDQHDIAELLISLGADVCQLDATGKYTPMFYAIKHNCSVPVIRRLILAGASKDGIVEYNFRSSALHLAVYCNKKNLVKFLLSLSVDINSKDINDATPLHVAVQENHPNIVKKLVLKGAKLDAETSNKFTPLMLAIHDNSFKLVELLVTLGSDVNFEPENPKFTYQKPLNYAAGLGHVEIVQLLLNKGADPKSSTSFGDSPFHSMAYSDKLTDKSVVRDIIQILIDNGGDLNCYNNVGCNPLHSSIIMKNTVVTKSLLKAGSSVSTPTKNKDTPLHLAAIVGNSAIVKLLFSSGADLAAKNCSDLAPYDLALKQADLDTVRVFWSYGQPHDDIRLQSRTEINEDVQRLLKQQERFFHSVEFGLLDEMVNSLENGAEPKGCSLSMKYPLHYSVSQCHAEVVHELLERAVPVGRLNDKGETPLHLASKSGQTSICFDLLAHGASYNSRGHCGKTPYQVARENKQKDTMELLKLLHISFEECDKKINDSDSWVNDLDAMCPRRAFLNCINNKGHTILSKATSSGVNEEAQKVMYYRFKYLNIKTE